MFRVEPVACHVREMLLIKIKVKLWIMSILLYCNIPNSDGYGRCDKACETTVLVQSSIDSAILLPCKMAVDGVETVLWSQATDLVAIRARGYVNFWDNRGGRVKTFPYLFGIGNFSIQLESLQQSDVGTYCCQIQNGSACNKVNVTLHEERHGHKVSSWKSFLGHSWYYIAPVGVLPVLLVFGYVCHLRRRSEPADADYVNESCCEENSGVTIYENNEQDLSWKCVREINSDQTPASQNDSARPCSRTERIPEKLYYANQSEINIHTGPKRDKNKRSFWRRKNNESFQCSNPIYSNSQEQLTEY